MKSFQHIENLLWAKVISISPDTITDMKCLICYSTTDIKNNSIILRNQVVSGSNKEDCYNKVIDNPYWNRPEYPQAVVNIIEL